MPVKGNIMKNIYIAFLVVFMFVSCAHNRVNEKDSVLGENCIVIDVRTEKDYDAGHLSGAILIPRAEIKEKIETLVKDKEEKIVLYCRSGKGAGKAEIILKEMGYKNVTNAGPYEKLKKNETEGTPEERTVQYKSLEERISRLEDRNEIQNTMSKYSYYTMAGESEKKLQLFAQKTPGVTAEIGSRGVYEGIEGVRKLFLKVIDRQDRTGVLIDHDLTTPIIEVAGDGKTAKGLWLSPGFVSSKDPETDELEGIWSFVKYSVDFVKEEGQWKIWHFHVYLILHATIGEGFEKGIAPTTPIPELPDERPELPDEIKPDKPTSYHKPYDRNGSTELVPVPPEPYETY